MKEIYRKLILLYGEKADEVLKEINHFIAVHKKSAPKNWITEKDVILITYGDSIKEEGKSPLNTLKHFLDEQSKGSITAVHLLPIFPYTSDDGFSITDYRQINPDLGVWKDIENLASNYDLMFDAVINHISISSEWFKEYQNGNKQYADYFIECDESKDYNMVTRPRALPLYYKYKTKKGDRNIWATFSKDQVDLNFQNPKVLMEILDLLVFYTNKGARFIRLDAIGFIWKKMGSTCMNLKETHALIQLMHQVLEIIAPGTILVSETNVPHAENVSYFGNGFNEAQMIYQFPLPPLVLYSFLSGDATRLSEWAMSLNDTKLSNKTTYLNFLASHDGIGMIPTEGILSEEEKAVIFDNVNRNGGKISYKLNEDGSNTPYELNINYQDALYKQGDSDDVRIMKFLASQSILLSLQGVPGIYIHSFLGSRNDVAGMEESGINRRINRKKMNYSELVEELKQDKTRKTIFDEYLRIIEIRKIQSALSPEAEQEIVVYDKRLFSFKRHSLETNKTVHVIVNTSNDYIKLETDIIGVDLISNKKAEKEILIEPYQYLWISN